MSRLAPRIALGLAPFVAACGFFGLDYLSGGPTTVDPGHLSRVVAIALGASNACAVIADGTLVCWGDNAANQLCAAKSVTPNAVKPLVVASSATSVALTKATTCFRSTDGGVACCGSDSEGERAVAGCADPQVSASPVAATMQTVAGGYDVFCGIDDGGVLCWGDDQRLVAGDDGGLCQPAVVPIDGVVGATSVGIGTGHGCALQSDGTVACWGTNHHFALGNTGLDASAAAVPASLGGATSIVALAAGDDNTCVATGDGTLDCWGDSTFGQAGVAATEPEQIHAVAGVSKVVRVASAGDVGDGAHTCAVTADGEVYCFGSNPFGELGRGTADGNVTAHPDAELVLVSQGTPLENVADVACSPRSTCARTRDGFVYCWGRNDVGQLGDGTTTDRAFATQVVAQ